MKRYSMNSVGEKNRRQSNRIVGNEYEQAVCGKKEHEWPITYVNMLIFAPNLLLIKGL